MDDKPYTISEEQKQAFMPYLATISEKIGTIKPETVKAMFIEYSGKSEEFVNATQEMFKAADADGDGKLNPDEFVVFEKKRAAYITEKHGEALQFTDEEYGEHFQFFNAITPGEEGVS